jgi:hypothetical protein
MPKSPWLKFYIGDYIKDTRILPLEVRGACVDLCLYMWENEPKGEIEGTIQDFSRIMGCSIDEATRCLRIMNEKKIFNFGFLLKENNKEKLKENSPFASEANMAGEHQANEPAIIRITSRKQKRMAAESEMKKQTGKLGGNPILGGESHQPGFIYAAQRPDELIKIAASADPNKMIYKIKQREGTNNIQLLGALFVSDMAEIKNEFQEFFLPKICGEWCFFDEKEKESLLLLLKEKDKEKRNILLKEKVKGKPEYEYEHKDRIGEVLGGMGGREGEREGGGEGEPPGRASPLREPEKGWIQFPGPEQFDLALPDDKAKAALELIILTGTKAEKEHIEKLWEVFKIQNFTGRKFYQSANEVFSHFINWSKTQKINGTVNPKFTTHGKSEGAVELAEKLARKFAARGNADPSG